MTSLNQKCDESYSTESKNSKEKILLALTAKVVIWSTN